jgi:predicted nucleic acid-binding protein
MTRSNDTPVVVDTGVFGARLTPAGHELAFQYRPLLAGRPAVLSYATVAELRFGATLAGWGTRRIRRLDDELAQVPTVWPGPSLTAAYVDLRVWCSRSGHGLAHKDHEADRWIAATARWLDVPLVAHDAIFKDVDGLQLLTQLA